MSSAQDVAARTISAISVDCMYLIDFILLDYDVVITIKLRNDYDTPRCLLQEERATHDGVSTASKRHGDRIG